MDWGAGEYEHTASQLLPAAREVIEHAAPRAGERLVDVGCGTGNAALLAAERGAEVTGVDPARRLLEVARARASGTDISFLEAEAARLPCRDASAEVLVSVFGVIFAPDPAAAVTEMARVAGPDARVVLSAWLPRGPLAEVIGARSQALAAAAAAATSAQTDGGGEAPSAEGANAPFAWHELDALVDLFAPHGFSVELEEHQLAFVAASPSEFLDAELRVHPSWIAARAVLEPRGEMAALGARTLAILNETNENPAAFRITGDYVVMVSRRGRAASPA
jgi:SAM-dependent methyltransferase